MPLSALYAGDVHHTRFKPARHHLKYSIFMGLFDIDELDALAHRITLFSRNRFNLVSFHDKDHGNGSRAPLRAQVETALSDANLPPPAGPIRILCMPRVLGAVFNPLSVYFCYDAANVLRAIVHEVHNTYGERHFYALPAEAASGRVAQDCDKAFRVSPLTPMHAHYRFNIESPGSTVAVSILMSDTNGPLLTASFTGTRSAFTSANIVQQVLAHPALALKVVVGIHWEALITWIKLHAARIKPGHRRAARASGR